MKKLLLLFVLFTVILTVKNTSAQINILAGATITQNFDIGLAANDTMPDGWRVDTVKNTPRSIDPYSSAGTQTFRAAGNLMSATAGNGIYNFAAGDPLTVTDRAIGGLSSSSASKSVNVYAYFHNNGSTDISDFTISYDVEKYRNGLNAAGFSMQLYYSTDGTIWTTAGVDFLTSLPADADNLGYALAPGSTVNILNKTLSLNVAAGTDLYLAWNYSVTSGLTTSNAQALGIDNFSITANASSLVPYKLSVTDVNSGNSAIFNTAFPVTIEVKDINGNPINAISNINFTLMKATGTGTLGGTYTGTVTTGTNSVVLSGVTYNTVENGVSIYAHENTSALTYDTSAVFNVLASVPIASKLVITEINLGNNPVQNAPFDITVQSQDNSSNPANVSVLTTVNITLVTGTGSLSGTLTGNILAGSNSVNITGIIYNVAETGVSLLASDASSLLTAGTSSTFTVDELYPLIATLPTSYDWAPSSSFPSGWYNSGLGVPYNTGNIAANSGRFDVQGANFVVHYNDTAGSVIYSLKKNGTTYPYQFDVLESTDGFNYTTLASHINGGLDSLTGSYKQFVRIPNSDSRFVKFVYTTRPTTNIAIDDVTITSNATTSNATVLKVLSVNGGVSPGIGVPFNVQVQTQDNLGSPSAVASDVNLVLSVLTGTGTLTGIVTGTILSGTHTAFVTGVVYSVSENGVSLLASDVASTLIADTSDLFNVTNPFPVATSLPTSYDWAPPTTTYPIGWYQTGLEFYVTGNLAPNSGKFNNIDDNLVIFFDDTASRMTFFLKKNGATTPYQFDVLESSNGASFSLLKTFTDTGDSLKSQFTEYRVYPQYNTRLLKFNYTNKPSGTNVAIDDVVIEPLIQQAPFVDTAYATSLTTVKVIFSEIVNVTAENISNYTGLGTIVSAPRTIWRDEVTLSLSSALQVNVAKTLTINNVQDSAGNAMLAPQSFQIKYSNIGISNNETFKVNIYPNPSKGIINIETEKSDIEITIENLLGSIVYSKQLSQNNSSIDVSSLDKGIYIIRVMDKSTNSIANKKIIIN